MDMKKKIALIYDFDGTLAPGNMQEYSFIPSLNMDADEFWDNCFKFSIENNMDSILSYMYLMVSLAKEKNAHINKEAFYKQAKSIKYFKGVTDWFERINEFGKSHDIQIEHYIISCGIKEILEGTKIAKEFKKIFACSFCYDKNDIPIWPSQAVNYTTKTQYIFRIRKGMLDNLYDDSELNEYVYDRSILLPYSNMIYIGDGTTDIPCMKIIKQNGGHCICVYDPDNEKKKLLSEHLLNDKRANFIAPADYRKNKKLENVVKDIILKIAIDNKLSKY